MNGVRRMYALTNTFSGVAGEARVAAALVRAGFRIAKPYWNDDEVDLLLLYPSTLTPGLAFPLPIQVKSVQFLPQKDGSTRQRVGIQGFQKRYLAKSQALILAIYRVDTDEIFCIEGQSNIKKLYEEQQTWNKKHVPFDQLKDKQDVRISVHQELGIPGDWLIQIDSPTSLSKRISRLVDDIEQADQLVQDLAFVWDDEVEPDAAISEEEG